jgi:hypothetical protein
VFLVAQQSGVRRAAELVKVGRHHTAKCLTWKMSDARQNCRLKRMLGADGPNLQHPLSTRLRPPSVAAHVATLADCPSLQLEPSGRLAGIRLPPSIRETEPAQLRLVRSDCLIRNGGTETQRQAM